jgi:hypothetical protein
MTIGKSIRGLSAAAHQNILEFWRRNCNQIADYNAGARNVGEVCVINEILGGRPR